MNQKDLKELRKYCSAKNINVLTVYGAFVNENHQMENLFCQDLMENLPEDLRTRIIALLRKSISGKLGSNVLPVGVEYGDEKQKLTEDIIRTNFKDQDLRREFFERISQAVKMDSAYIILAAVNSFDVLSKSSDDLFSESDGQFSCVMCSICPVKRPEHDSLYYSLSAEGIYEQSGELYVSNPSSGFVYPSYENGGANVSEVLYYTKDTKILDSSLIQAMFTPTQRPISAEAQRTDFNTALAEALEEECDTDTLLMIHDSIREWSKELEDAPYDDAGVSSEDVAVILRDSGMQEEQLSRFREIMGESSGTDRNLSPANLVPQKDTYETPYVKISISPEYRDQVRTDVINGRKCIIVYADEGVSVNGVNVSFHSEDAKDGE